MTATQTKTEKGYLGLGPMTMISTRLPVKHLDLAKRIAERNKSSLAQVLREGIELKAKEQ